MINTSMQVVKNYPHVLQAPDCSLQEIFLWRKPEYENYGVLGWNCDLYVDQINEAIIVTGYRNLKGVEIPKEIIKEYKERAIEIYEKYRKGLFYYGEARVNLIQNATAFTASAIKATMA